MTKRVILLFTTVLLLGFAKGQGGWELKTDKEGIKVYTRGVPGSKIKAIKITSTMNTTLSQLAVAIFDVNTAKQWVYSTKSCVLLKRVSPAELYYYSEVNVPWPISNRDFIAHLKLRQDPATKVLTVDAENVTGIVPVKPNVVRVTNATGKWVASPAGPNQVKVEYTLFTDPGGNIPAWLSNMFVTKGPFESFKKLEKLLSTAYYNDVKFDFVMD